MYFFTDSGLSKFPPGYRKNMNVKANRITLIILAVFLIGLLLGQGKTLSTAAPPLKITTLTFTIQASLDPEMAGNMGDDIRLPVVMQKYWVMVLFTVLIIGTLLFSTLYILHLNRELKESKLQLQEIATHDILTGLPNRILYEEFGNKSLANAKREGQQVAVLFMDLDRFKPVNDTYGHNVGDELLKRVAVRIQDIIRDSDIVARQGGDEFVLLLQNVRNKEAAAEVMERLLEGISKPYKIYGHDISVECSIGASLFPRDDDNLTGLMRKADKALYRVKHTGRKSFRFYDPELNGKPFNHKGQ